MRKTIKYIIAAAVAAATTSCNFLDEPLKGGYTSETYYSDAARAEMAVNAVYNSLYGHNLWVFADVASDDSVKGGNAGDQADINYINDFTAKADNGPISQFWQHSYETIARANNVCHFVAGMSINDELKARYVGEAKFLRAYKYFLLVNIFGEVPVKTEPQNSQEAIHVGLSSVEDIYAQIDKDLTDAVAVLPETYPVLESGRVTKGAALALLAKSKLFQEDYAACLSAISELEAIGKYNLLANYSDLFKRGAENCEESIFAIRYINNTTAQRGNNLVVWFAPAVQGGYSFNAPTQDYVNCFSEKCTDDSDDPRLDASIGRDGKEWFNGETFSKKWSEATGYLVKKYNEDLPEEEAIAQSTIPQHILRYADVLLMKAEAQNETGADPSAALDAVRARAGLPAASTVATGKEQLRDLIRVERRRELGFEFHRFFDVMRYGKEYATSVLPDLPKDTDRFYFPLPVAETDVNTSIK